MEKKSKKGKNSKLIIMLAIIILVVIIAIVCFLLVMPKSNNLTNNPADEEIKQVIEQLDGVYDICMVTEDNDPNGNLNKQGGYTGAVYFRLEQVDEALKDEAINRYGEEFVNSGDWENFYDEAKDTCDAGTGAGGQIEIYPNKSTAEKRDEYLSTLDGFLSGGYHIVEGSLVIRVSDELPSSQQKEIANNIINLLKK